MMKFNGNFANFAGFIGEDELKDILLCVEVNLMKKRIDIVDVGYKKVDKFHFADFRFDINKIFVLDLIHDPLFFAPMLGMPYYIGSFRTHMYFSLVM
jgi:hypothetical protein